MKERSEATGGEEGLLRTHTLTEHNDDTLMPNARKHEVPYTTHIHSPNGGEGEDGGCCDRWNRV